MRNRKDVFEEINDLKEQVKILQETVNLLMDEKFKPTFMDFRLVKENTQLRDRLEYQRNYLPF